MSEHRKKSKPGNTPSGWIEFPVISDDRIVHLADHRVRNRVEVSERSYSDFYDQFTHCSHEVLKKYRAILKSHIAFWESWVNSMASFRFTMFGAFAGTGISLAVPSVLHYFFKRVAHEWLVASLEVPRGGDSLGSDNDHSWTSSRLTKNRVSHVSGGHSRRSARESKGVQRRR